MAEYGNMEPALAGLKDGLGGRVESWAAGEEIAFGAAVFGYAGNDGVCFAENLRDTGKITLSGNFTVETDIVVTVNGIGSAPVDYATGHNETVAAVAAAVNALAGVEAKVDASNKKIIWVRTKGAKLELAIAKTGGALTATMDYGTSSKVFLGIALRTDKEEAKYLTGEAVNVMSFGRAWGLVDTTATANTDAKIEGNRFKTGGSLASNSRFRSDAKDVTTLGAESAVKIAIVEVNGQKDVSPTLDYDA